MKVSTTAQHQRDADSASGTVEGDSRPYGAVVLKLLVAQWAGTKRIICADSCFPSIAAAMLLLMMGLRFIGVVKTATRGCPMGALSVIPVEAHGAHTSFTHVNAEGQADTMAVMWVRQGASLLHCHVLNYSFRGCVREVQMALVGARAERVALTFDQPAVAEIHYSGCASIDSLTSRQDDLKLEHKFVTQNWSMRVNLSLLGICIVDSWML